MEKLIKIKIFSIKQYQNEKSSKAQILNFIEDIHFYFRSESQKCHSPIDKEIERITSDLLDRIVSKDEEKTASNALSLLQNFVIKQTPSTILLNQSNKQMDLNNNCDDENSNQSEKIIKSNESPLASLEKMLAYPSSTTTNQSSSLTLNEHGLKKKKFDKYRLFAEKMLRSTL